MIYVGKDYPQWREGEPRRINSDEWRSPDLVGEVFDTTLATDLDEKKQLYSGLGIPEYWVVDMEGGWVLAFQLHQDERYQQTEYSTVLQGLVVM
ncbi:Uma2 family endonuclease [Microcoleus sp. FACHB-1515]|uniref:Uma2 family endonuclease n=1 Tax=Cyanophyceae TaxID=3028117 RepID=UPI0028C39777|nr:Uma2 family endonuclease [Microcoleus sp. FACHB-1515]